jgi:hypothetical protein
MSNKEPPEVVLPEAVMIAVTPGSRIYLEALETYGLLEGEQGQERLPDSVREVLNALHHVLGGGTVSVEIQSDGTSSIVDELGTALQNAEGTCGDSRFANTGVHCP